MKSAYGVHCFCFECGTNWSEYKVPSRCIYCSSTDTLAYSRTLINSDDHIGVVRGEPMLIVEQCVFDGHTSTAYTVPLPRNVYTLDSFIFDKNAVLDLNGEFLCSVEFYLEQILEIR